MDEDILNDVVNSKQSKLLKRTHRDDSILAFNFVEQKNKLLKLEFSWMDWCDSIRKKGSFLGTEGNE
jgi:hypothetical protein